MNPSTPEAARALLAELGAPARLLRHAELVGEAAEALLTGFARLGISLRLTMSAWASSCTTLARPYTARS